MTITSTRLESAGPETPPQEEASGARLHGFALFSVMAALMITLLLEALDQSILAPALPKIIGTLQGFDRYTWVMLAYILASATMIPVIGKLSDQFGRKWSLLVGVVVFLLGSALSGMAQTIDQLIFFRAVQGLGAGTGIALVFTVIGDIFTPAERARWQGLMGSVYALSNLVGPTLGGWLTDHGPLLGSFVTTTTRWREIFYVNLPLGALALGALLIFLPRNISARSNRYTGLVALRHTDFLGALLATSATICLQLGLTWGSDQTYEWSAPQVAGLVVIAIILYAMFVFVESRAAEPILPLDFFKNRVFTADALLALTSGMALAGLAIYLPLFLQVTLGVSATISGLLMIAMTMSMVVGSAISGIVIARLGRYQRITVLGAFLLTAGVFLMTQVSSGISMLVVILSMALSGVGLGMFYSVITLVVQNVVPRTRMGSGTSAVNYLKLLGQMLGLAAVGTIVNNTVFSDVMRRLPASVVKGLNPEILKQAINPQALSDMLYRTALIQRATGRGVSAATAQRLFAQVFDVLRLSLTTSIKDGFFAALFFCGGVLLASFFLKDIPLARHFQDKENGDSSTTAKISSDQSSQQEKSISQL